MKTTRVMETSEHEWANNLIHLKCTLYSYTSGSVCMSCDEGCAIWQPIFRDVYKLCALYLIFPNMIKCALSIDDHIVFILTA